MNAQEVSQKYRLKEMHRQNKEPNKNGTSGACGVSWSERRHKWRAYVRHNGRTNWLGEFRNKDTAIEVVNKFREKITVQEDT